MMRIAFSARIPSTALQVTRNLLVVGVILLLAGCANISSVRGTADLATVVARATGEVAILDTSTRQFIGIEGHRHPN